MMQTIEVKVLGPTDTLPTRVKARQSGGPYNVTVSYGIQERIEDAADEAALKLASELHWDGPFVCGSTRNGWVYVFADDRRVG